MGFLDQMKQLMEIKQKMEETKKRLEAMELIAENDYVKVTANGNRKIKDVTILKTDDKVLLEGKLQSAVNEALEKADAVMQSEMLGATKGMLPDMPGLPGMG
jgi:DNA-binding protein YbaB